MPANANVLGKDSWESSPESKYNGSAKSCRHVEDCSTRRRSQRSGAETTKACFVSKEKESFDLPPFGPRGAQRTSSSSSHAGSIRRSSSAASLCRGNSTTIKAPSSNTDCWLSTPSTTASSTPSLSQVDAPKDYPNSSIEAPLRITQWRCGSKIGQGSYGCVHKGLDMATGTLFAVKKVVIQEDDEDKKAVNSDELEILRCLRHPNIVSFLGYEMKERELCIFMDFVPGGSLSALVSEFGALDGKLLRQATLGMLQGLDYLHLHNPPIIHRDIKGANVLVDKDFGIKLTDFGCSKRCDVSTSFTTIGSIPWMAPEVISQQNGYGRKADIWSLGCTIIELASAETPWGKGAFDNVMFALKRIGLSEEIPHIPEDLPSKLQHLVRSCLTRNADARPTTTELVYHDFFLGRVCGNAAAMRRTRRKPQGQGE